MNEQVIQVLGSMYSLAPHPWTNSPWCSASEYKQFLISFDFL